MGEEIPRLRQRKVYGWVLRLTGWVMRGAGTAGAIVGLLGMRISGSASSSLFGYRAPTWQERFLVFFMVMIAGVVILYVSLHMARYARRHLAQVIKSPASLKPGSYVLYLRPFSQDKRAAGIPVSAGSGFNAPVNIVIQSGGRTHEERLARTFREFGQLVAVGRPEEMLPIGSGARRMYIPRAGWELIVSELIDNARLILLGAGPGMSTAWEYVEVMRRGDPSRLIVLVTDRDGYQRFKTSAIAEAEGALTELQSRHGCSWQAPILPDLPRPAKPGNAAAFYVKAMLYFSVGWEPHLAFFDASAVHGSPRAVGNQFRDILAPVMAHIRVGRGDLRARDDQGRL